TTLEPLQQWERRRCTGTWQLAVRHPSVSVPTAHLDAGLALPVTTSSPYEDQRRCRPNKHNRCSCPASPSKWIACKNRRQPARIRTGAAVPWLRHRGAAIGCWGPPAGCANPGTAATGRSSGCCHWPVRRCLRCLAPSSKKQRSQDEIHAGTTTLQNLVPGVPAKVRPKGGSAMPDPSWRYRGLCRHLPGSSPLPISAIAHDGTIGSQVVLLFCRTRNRCLRCLRC
ncbi:hypothetical protein CCMA1212_004295, partial [Trichoderma ghanense]